MESKTIKKRTISDSRSVPYLREARQTRLLKTLLMLAVIYTLYLAKSLLIPLFFSAFIALLLSPLVRVGRKILCSAVPVCVGTHGIAGSAFHLFGVRTGRTCRTVDALAA